MQDFCNLATLFVIGCVGGWVIEFFFRRIFTAKRWVNPGFMIGPYLPLYGFGVMAIYVIFYLVAFIPDEAMSDGWKVVLGIAIVGVVMTLIEFIAGLIFIKGMKIKLWDYSKRKGNIMGIICPLFSLIWLVCGGIFYALLLGPLTKVLTGMHNNPWYVIFIGIILGCMLMDCIVSVYYSQQVKKFNTDADMRYDEMKVSFRREYNFKEKKNHFYGIIDITSETATNLPDAIKEIMEKHPDADIMAHYEVNGTKVMFENPIKSAKQVPEKLAKEAKEKAIEAKEAVKEKTEEIKVKIESLKNKKKKEK